MRQLIALAFSLALSAVLTAQSASSRPSADALAHSLQQRYQSIRDFSADFTHSYRGGVLRTQTREQGTVSVKKPGQMRWVYTSPERKEFVSDGRKIYSYLPADRQVRVTPVPPDSEATTPALFLAGKGDIARDFKPSYVESPIAGALALKLVPKRSEQDYEYLVVVIDPATLQIRALTTHDTQGGDSTLTFTNLKENRGIPDKEFAFSVPRGVDVVNDARN